MRTAIIYFISDKYFFPDKNIFGCGVRNMTGARVIRLNGCCPANILNCPKHPHFFSLVLRVFHRVFLAFRDTLYVKINPLLPVGKNISKGTPLPLYCLYLGSRPSIDNFHCTIINIFCNIIWSECSVQVSTTSKQLEEAAGAEDAERGYRWQER